MKPTVPGIDFPEAESREGGRIPGGRAQTLFWNKHQIYNIFLQLIKKAMSPCQGQGYKMRSKKNISGPELIKGMLLCWSFECSNFQQKVTKRIMETL